ncbi:sugar O-acyltransferase (sialic acid O-acetyltransferase NeuD family) [Mariniflexile fucanivorans]|uniref:Sugar O-acyltransferase (Sialic acid O-acetyltransferase NeuD family) n=1 Tax=Mariniflexile fucanivorans TaxID=264023 RepID=A0A4R1RDF7_9FLAO|nr:NeuD/PglB/VioB family sugar acetyltransferase [Mariniflexile fucanivorans]TCL63873.1 sugar O-acyltransferase (sialic acid O-acetyltransferase NeuD family) [Mariniflexile fucanivorans]
MLIVGAKGLAKELLQVLSIDMNLSDESILFFDNVSHDLPEKIYNRFKILNSFDAVENYFKAYIDKSFVLGLGHPLRREKLYKQFVELGANPIILISKSAEVGDFEVEIKEGTSILAGARISNSVQIGKGCLIYYNSVVAHDSNIGDFVEISPNVTILGRCIIGNNSTLGAGCVILPDVIIGENVKVGAGAVILKDVPDNSTIVGVPGRVIKSF